MSNIKNLNTDAGLKQLNEYLATRSYIQGYTLSSEDVAVFQQIPHNVDSDKFAHVSRWFKHVRCQPEWVLNNLGSSKQESKSSAAPKSKPNTPQVKSATPKQKPSSPAKSPAKAPAKKAEDDDDDFDLFGADDGEAAKKVAELNAKKEEANKAAKKEAPVAKSSVILDVKPEDLETDMEELKQKIKAITKEGLSWGAADLIPVAYGIKKLRIIATIVDELISVDDLQEEIEGFEGVQSTDIHAFNKL